MEERLDFLDFLMESDVVGYQIFNLKYKKENKKKVIYCLAEGEDYKYYHSRVQAITGLQPVFIKCDGREGVQDTLNLIKSYDVFKEDYIYGFIDRDYFQIDVDDEVYVTEHYSIESYYCLENSIASVLEYHWKLSRDWAVLNHCFNLYQKLHQKFVEEILFFSVWSSIQVMSTYQEKLEFKKIDPLGVFKPNNYIILNSVDITKIANISLNDIEAPNLKSVESIVASNKAFKKAKYVTNEEVNEIISSLSEADKREFIRGKFELQFMEKYLNLLSIKLNLQHSLRIPQNIEDPLSTLSTYAHTSPSLKNYLLSIYSISG